jgi:nucleolar protein 15
LGTYYLPGSSTPSLTIWSSRVPRGFFEPQMKKYFAQFGPVTKLRLSRNKKTGASKHYAFVEFASAEVADIVARTMDNYLMFGHILKCKLIPADQVSPDLFKGANQRFKVDPRNKKAGLAMERGAEREVWEKRVVNENKRRSGRNKALKADFDYEFAAPSLKAVADVPEQSAALQDAASQQLLDEAASAAVAEQPQAKKGKKAVAAPVTTVVQTAEVVEPTPEKKGKKVTKTVVVEETPAAAEPEKKAKKDTKKRKSDAVAEIVAAAAAEETPAAAAPAPKKKAAAKKAVVAEDKPAVAPKAKKAKKAKA